MVRESCAEKFAELFAGRATAAEFRAVGGWFFEAFCNEESSGGFWVIPKPAGAEWHTELRLRGKQALAAAERLKVLLATQYGVSRVTGYVMHENRPAKIFAARIGFRRVWDSPDRTHYEMLLNGQ